MVTACKNTKCKAQNYESRFSPMNWKYSFFVFVFPAALRIKCSSSVQFLREQAALSAAEITADSVNDFIADSEGESEVEDISDNNKRSRPLWEKILMNVVEKSSQGKCSNDFLPVNYGTVWTPKVNGKHNKHVQTKGDLLSQGNGVAKMIQASIPRYKEVLPGLESWQASKVASWHSLEGHSIQWFCVVCIDRRGNSSFIQWWFVFRLMVAYLMNSQGCDWPNHGMINCFFSKLETLGENLIIL